MRNIFDKAQYGHKMKAQLEENQILLARAKELESQVIPNVPQNDTPMEVETSLPPRNAPTEPSPSPREQTQQNINHLFEEALKDIKVQLQAPEGYILFPEPPHDESEDEPRFEVVPSE